MALLRTSVSDIGGGMINGAALKCWLLLMQGSHWAAQPAY